MDPLMILLRIVHIGVGLFWAGAGIFVMVVLNRRLKLLDPLTGGRVIAAIAPVSGIAFTVAGYLVVASGVTIALKLRWGVLESFFSTGWGYAILIAFIMALASAIIGPTLIVPAAGRVETLVKDLSGELPTPEQTSQLRLAIGRFSRVVALDGGLIAIALGAMAAARWL